MRSTQGWTRASALETPGASDHIALQQRSIRQVREGEAQDIDSDRAIDASPASVGAAIAEATHSASTEAFRGHSMLSMLTARHVEPEVEAIDRDPGIITLTAGLVRTIRRYLMSASGRTRTGQGLARAQPLSSSTAWPHRRG